MNIQCPKCEQTLQVPENAASKRVKCPKCQQVFEAKAAAPSQEAESEISARPIPKRPTPGKSRPPEVPSKSQPERRRPPRNRNESGSSSSMLLMLALLIGGFVVCLCLPMLAGVGYYLATPQQLADNGPRDFGGPNPAPAPGPGPGPNDPPIVVPPPAADPAVKNAVVVQLKSNFLVYDPARALIYASVGNDVPGVGNSVVAINPATGQQAWSVQVGSNPNVLALSHNSQALWVALRGSGAIQRIDLNQRVAGPQHSLGKGAFGATFAETMVVAPGTTDTVVVSLFRQGISPRHDGVAVYDNGMQRLRKTKDHTGSNRLAAVGPNLIFGYNNETTEFGLRRLQIEADGIREVQVFEGVVSNFNVDIGAGGNKVFSTRGDVVDPNTGNSLGKLAAEGPFAIDGPGKRAYYLTGGEIQAFDTDRLIRVAALRLPNANQGGTQLIMVGGAGFAYRTDNQIVIVSRKDLR